MREFLGVKNICFFGVFDGHGADGAKVSNELVGKLPYFLMNCAAFEVIVKPADVKCSCCATQASS